MLPEGAELNAEINFYKNNEMLPVNLPKKAGNSKKWIYWNQPRTRNLYY